MLLLFLPSRAGPAAPPPAPARMYGRRTLRYTARKPLTLHRRRR